MAHQAPYNANRLAKSSEHPTEYNHKAECYQSANDLEHNVNIQADSPLSSATNHTHEPLRMHVERVVRQYFAMLGDEMPTDLYALILKEIEQPLLSVVLEQSRGNQTKCAQILGLNRGTLRKKLKTYDLM